MPFDQPLYISNNPDYMRQELMFELTMNIQSIIEDVGISKRELARSLKTSVTQINRLLDQTNYNKDLSRLIQIASLLNYDFDWELKSSISKKTGESVCMKSILVTGGAGFIGSNFVPYFVEKYSDYKIINLDKLTYAGNLENLKEVEIILDINLYRAIFVTKPWLKKYLLNMM